MMKTFCFKLYQTKRNRRLHRQINAAGVIYNHCIALHKRYYRLFHKSLHVFRLINHLAKLKKSKRFGILKEIGSQAVQDVAERINRAYNRFFNDLKRKARTAPPSFRKITKYKSFTLKQAGWKLCGDNVIIINKRRYKYFKSREIEGKVKTVTVKRDMLGHIYLYFVCELQQDKIAARTGESVGYDFGLKRFLTASNEEDIDAPLFFHRNATAIKKASRDLSRKKKGSRHRKRARLALARLYKKTANQRRDFHFKTARTICKKYVLICLEDLNVRAMQRRWGRKISDLGFADFVKILEYEASCTGSSVIKIDKFYPSTQICNQCGYQNPETKDLSLREWTCPSCGEHHDRDRNAAKNILKVGASTFLGKTA